MLRTGFDPRMPIPEMKIAQDYFAKLGRIGGQLLAVCWALATFDVSLSMFLIVASGYGLYLVWIGKSYRDAYPKIMASLSGTGRIRLFAKAWQAFVAIVIVSGLGAGAFSWHQMGEIKTQVLGLAAVPLASWALNKLQGD